MSRRGVPAKIGTPLLWLLGAAAMAVVAGCQIYAENQRVWESAHLRAADHSPFGPTVSYCELFLAFAVGYAVMRYAFRLKGSEGLGALQFWIMVVGALLTISPSVLMDLTGIRVSGGGAVRLFAIFSGAQTLGYFVTWAGALLTIPVVVGAFRHRHRPA